MVDSEDPRRPTQPEALKQDRPWMWSPGAGTDVWAMFMASMDGDLDTVKRLVHRDPSLVRSHYEYRTLLGFAVRANQLAVAEFLLDLGAAKVGLGDPFEAARDRGLVEMERLLTRKFAELHGASAAGDEIAAAIRAYYLPRVRVLLDASPDLLHAGDRSSNQPIHWAAMTRQLPLIDDLVARGVALDAARLDGARPIHLTNGDYFYRGWRDVPAHVTTTPNEVYRHLVALGATVDIWMAAVKGDIACVTALIDQDPRLVNGTPDDPPWATPLAWARRRGHGEIVKRLSADS